jgi:hypothetical protein
MRHCPSAQPGMDDVFVLGVIEVAGGRSKVAYLEERVPFTPEIAALAGPVSPTRVMRLAARCEENRCVHFGDGKCGLATRIAAMSGSDSLNVPACTIRNTCRWFRQEGIAACRNCERVETEAKPESEFASLAFGS